MLLCVDRPRTLARALAISAVLLASDAAHAETAPGAAALESRLRAPCCYEGTLDHHDSELARQLRKEIEQRLARGESSDAVQADFVARYGDEVIAARSDAPIRAMTLSLGVALAASAMALAWVLRRWLRRKARHDGEERASALEEVDGLDARIDAAVAELD